MSSRKLNVLVYTGTGTTVESIRHCLFTLRRLLSPNYAVIPCTSDMILNEPWQASCAALVIPGGADLGYCRTLNGAGNRRIKQYVERGGRYIGFCAGAYYGSKRCEFEVGNKQLEVVGDRELAFFPGTARGCAFKGFVYHSEKGARAAHLKVNKDVLSTGTVPNMIQSYYNGGCVFVDAVKLNGQGVEVLAEYAEQPDVDPGQGQAAVVLCQAGAGSALLTGPHPEFVFGFKGVDNWSSVKPKSLPEPKKEEVPGFRENVVDVLLKDEKHRINFLKACLSRMGLLISDEQNVPSLSHIYLSSLSPTPVTRVLDSLTDIAIQDATGIQIVQDENDKFLVSRSDLVSSVASLSLDNVESERDSATAADQITDFNAIPKRIIVPSTTPDPKFTPYFNHMAFYNHLEEYRRLLHLSSSASFGSTMLYGEVVTSTNTLLEKNTKLLRRLPHGTTFTATTQLAGRGRGSNVWISPAGSLMYSVVIKHPMTAMASAPVVFIQYLAAMAVIRAVKTYDRKLYNQIPIKLKWPNDIYALDPDKVDDSGATTDRNDRYTKIGGILVNSHYNSKEYIAVCGVGINTSNDKPSTSLNQLIRLLPAAYRDKVSPFQLERLLASILASFEALYEQFMVTGFDEAMEKEYYENWLHMDQIVTVESEGGVRAQIKGITRDYGLLLAEELGWEDRPTGKKITLMSDSNSFDFFRGLLKRKV